MIGDQRYYTIASRAQYDARVRKIKAEKVAIEYLRRNLPWYKRVWNKLTGR
jgi:hypothetical protein